jgi:profilin
LAGELKHIATNFGNMSVMPMSGITVAGTKFMFLSANDRVKGTSGVHIMKTEQAIIVSVYNEPILAEQCANVTEKLGEYLIEVGY